MATTHHACLPSRHTCRGMRASQWRLRVQSAAWYGQTDDVVDARVHVLRRRVEIEYFIGLLSMSPPLPQLAAVKPEPVSPLSLPLPPSFPPPSPLPLPLPLPSLSLSLARGDAALAWPSLVERLACLALWSGPAAAGHDTPARPTQDSLACEVRVEAGARGDGAWWLGGQALLEKLRGIYLDFCEEDAVWVKTTEFKGGAAGGPPLATNHDVKAVEYFIK